MFGNLIRDARFKRGLSLDIIASELMIEKSVLMAYENNSLIPPHEDMKLLSCYIGFKVPTYYEKFLQLYWKSKPSGFGKKPVD